MVSDILRLPLRAVVASSSATRSSHSAQQSPPRSAALADGIATPPTNMPAAANSATRLLDFKSPPIIRTSPLDERQFTVPSRAGGLGVRGPSKAPSVR